ncbi:hypothetical protein CBR61_06845 [Porphyrobacter sp. CACIAM 03H1]|nr:hypothetical protein CBR61_06845 [Porphyrobacter sp. CACIAM 03H1]
MSPPIPDQPRSIATQLIEYHCRVSEAPALLIADDAQLQGEMVGNADRVEQERHQCAMLCVTECAILLLG